jgi:hypothetical protein
MSATWKPCDRLTVDDFKKHAAWTYDVERAAADEKSDETWVRPVKRGVDRVDDELFVRASLHDRDGAPVLGCIVTVRLSPRKRAMLSALIVLTPYYEPTPIEDNRLATTLNAALQRRLPLTYEIDVNAGGQHIQTKGRLSLQPLAPPESAPKKAAKKRV